LGRQHEPAGGMQDEVDRHRRVGELDGPQHLFGILDVDVPGDGKPKDAHRLLPVDEANGAAVPPRLQAPEGIHAPYLERALANNRLQRADDEEEPEDVEWREGHDSDFSTHYVAPTLVLCKSCVRTR